MKTGFSDVIVADLFTPTILMSIVPAVPNAGRSMMRSSFKEKSASD
jgi:hypothetical protein